MVNDLMNLPQYSPNVKYVPLNSRKYQLDYGSKEFSYSWEPSKEGVGVGCLLRCLKSAESKNILLSFDEDSDENYWAITSLCRFEELAERFILKKTLEIDLPLREKVTGRGRLRKSMMFSEECNRKSNGRFLLSIPYFVVREQIIEVIEERYPKFKKFIHSLFSNNYNSNSNSFEEYCSDKAKYLTCLDLDNWLDGLKREEKRKQEGGLLKNEVVSNDNSGVVDGSIDDGIHRTLSGDN